MYISTYIHIQFFLSEISIFEEEMLEFLFFIQWRTTTQRCHLHTASREDVFVHSGR